MNKVAAFALRRKNSILSMSEKMFCPPQPLRLVWVTPAYAGKSCRACPAASGAGDHPRVCREKTPMDIRKATATGSPPRVRGKAGPAAIVNGVGGITPAYAGKSLALPEIETKTRDHPRVCGEKWLKP